MITDRNIFKQVLHINNMKKEEVDFGLNFLRSLSLKTTPSTNFISKECSNSLVTSYSLTFESEGL